MDDNAKKRRIYGRGFYDGQQEAMRAMNMQMLADKERGLTGIARKVFDAVPISEPWRVSKIVDEVRRTGHGADHPGVKGALMRLVEIGLVRETSNDQYIRVAKRPKEQVEEGTKQRTEVVAVRRLPERHTSPSPASKADVQGALMSRLAGLAAEAKQLSLQLLKAAEGLETLMVEIDDEMGRIKSSSAKYKQFQELLKSMAD